MKIKKLNEAEVVTNKSAEELKKIWKDLYDQGHELYLNWRNAEKESGGVNDYSVAKYREYSDFMDNKVDKAYRDYVAAKKQKIN